MPLFVELKVRSLGNRGNFFNINYFRPLMPREQIVYIAVKVLAQKVILINKRD